jgi:signal transduction histidine kinase
MTPAAHTNTKRRLVLLFSVPLAFSLLFFFVNLAEQRTNIHLLEIHNLSSAVAELRYLATEAEASERGFLLTGDDHYLAPFKQAGAILPAQTRFSDSYADQRPDLGPQLKQLAVLVENRFVEANEILNTQRNQGFAAALERAKSGQSESTMNAIRKVADALQNRLEREEDSYIGNERALNRWIFVFFSLGSLVMIVVLVWLYNTLLSYLYGRDSAHAQLEALNEDLEGRIEQRTRDLTQANAELQQFAYVASHDLQEPLRTITSFSQLLANRYQSRLDEDADEFIGFIVTSARRMTDLINGLLALVRLRKAGQLTEPVSFETLLEEAQIALQAAIRENQAQIEHRPLPSLVVDRVQFSQVFQNLLLNAIKYRREEPPRIGVEAHRDSSNWIFSVSDNGRGFDQQFAERIFGLFQRLHGRDVEGTGMGLSIARKILERHGGRIWAESRENVGSTFYFSLPTSLEVSHKLTREGTDSASVSQLHHP